MKISKIYEKYNLMPSLQLHMYRVAGVAKNICENISEKVTPPDIISACLLHDMGNILKFDLDLYPEFLEPEGREYWQKQKDDMENKYGKDEHEATLMIIRELGVNDHIYGLVDSFVFAKAKINYESDDYDRMICMYSDSRVEPHGVVSLESRLEDGRKRYLRNKPGQGSEKVFKDMSRYIKKIEEKIFKNIELKPESIHDIKVKKIINELMDFDIKIKR